ncbi:MAG TPA: hypothetical protein DIC36_06255 [Gammaproteobacteria bacterium]|nr:hypothetical protein [Gammaproteobacteria bacterium]
MSSNTGSSKLPGKAFARLAVNGATIAITRGESHYERVITPHTAEELNNQHGVTPAQARAMLAGVLCGWRTNLANPDLYGPYGELLEEPISDSADYSPYGLN